MSKKMKKAIRFLLIIIIIISGLYTAYSYYREQVDDVVYENVDIYIEDVGIDVTLPEGEKKIPVLELDIELIKSYQIEYDWDSLLAQNKDIIGWLYVPDNEYINFPVVKGTNNSYYLNHDYTRAWNANGAAFTDYRFDGLDLCRVIYGHNMNRDSRMPMFTSIKYWLEEDYFNSHRIIYYTHANGKTIKYLVFAVGGFNVYDKEFDYLQTFFETEDELQIWLEKLQTYCTFYDLDGRTVDYRADEIMVLSTCDRHVGFGSNGRRVLFCLNLSNNEVNLDGVELP